MVRRDSFAQCESSTIRAGLVTQAVGSHWILYQRRTMNNINLNTLANVVTAVCAVILTIKIL